MESSNSSQNQMESSNPSQNKLTDNISEHTADVKNRAIEIFNCIVQGDNYLGFEIPVQNEKKDEDVKEQSSLNPITLTVLQGVYDDKSPLSNLRGIPHVLRIILEYIKSYWRSHIQIGEKAIRNYAPSDGQFFVQLASTHLTVRGPRYGKLIFPKPSDININMMPFIMAPTFKETFLPDYLKPYFNSLIVDGILEIRNRYGIMGDEMGKVCYISVQESWVEGDTSQRRGGIHTESPGKLTIKSEAVENSEESQGTSHATDEMGKSAKEKTGYVLKGEGSSANFSGIHGWGRSMGHLQGGIYMASTVPNSCKVWDCLVAPDKDEDGDIVGQFGDIEHLRNYLGEGHVMEENQMYWITDRTPHESLNLPVKTYRQWFRLVTSGVSLWFQDHSTKNPLGILPDPKLTKIVKGSKFEEESLVVVCPKYGFKQYKVRIKKNMQKQIRKLKK